MINVGVIGALGKMGQEVVKAVKEADDMTLTNAIDIFETGLEIAQDVHTEGNLEKSILIKKPDVMVDFTQPSSVFENAKICLKNGVRPVVGTTGLSDEQIKELEELSKSQKIGCIIAPNFSVGAVLMMQFAKTAAKYFDNAEIVELHHNQKKDAPSGTAIKTAKLIGEEKNTMTKGNCPEIETVQGARGAKSYSDVHIHSVRMPGYIASQEVIFGSSGQILKITHDTMERSCYMSGVLFSIRYVAKNNKFVYGLENIL